ncbi:MAG: AAA family ATPase [Anaerolineales bacterium]
MKFPYGLADFHKIITGGYHYLDRTERLRFVEEVGEVLLFLRPRRFGKSMWLSTLENYYDVNKAGEFERLFGHLAIGQNPTPLHNQYLILRWDFSGVAPHGSIEDIKHALHNHINGAIEQFTGQYPTLKHKITRHPTDSMRSFQSLLAAVQRSPHKLYLLIDEYDNFANAVLMSHRFEGEEDYKTLVFGEGILRAIFRVVKSAHGGLGLDRVFITGVSPVVMSDITSAFNIAKNIYLLPEMHDLCGFWEHEVEAMLTQVAAACDYPPEKAAEALDTMRTFYNGYLFSPGAEGLLYNPTLVFYFLEHFQAYCEHPHRILDDNLSTDAARLTFIAQRPLGIGLILEALQEDQPVTVFDLATRFGVVDMLTPRRDAAFLASLLYYLGVLTFAGETIFGELILRIPNLVVRGLYLERLLESWLPPEPDLEAARNAARALYQRGDLTPVCDFIERYYFPVLDNRDYRTADELTLKVTFLTILFNDTFYIAESETELERTFADLTLILRPQMRKFQLSDLLIEFKFVKLGAAGLTGAQARALPRAEAAALDVVQTQMEAARTQARENGARLAARHGAKLRLRAFAVISLGFERLVWEEIAL